VGIGRLELPTFPMESGRSEPNPAYVKMKRASKEMKPFNIESCGNWQARTADLPDGIGTL